MKSMKRGMAVLLAALLVMPTLPVKAAETGDPPIVESRYDGDDVSDLGGTDDEAGGNDIMPIADDESEQDESNAGGINPDESMQDESSTDGADSDEADADDPDSDELDTDDSDSDAGEDGTAGLEEDGDDDADIPEEDAADRNDDSRSVADEEPDADESDLDEFDMDGDEGLSAYAETVISSGTLNDRQQWTLDEAGTLTISGTGRMPNYYSGKDSPWYDVRSLVLKVVIEDGVTNVGYRAFYGCSSLIDVVLSDSVGAIESCAFENCEALASVTFGNGLKNIYWAAFCDCSSLTAIALPDSMVSISEAVFSGCKSLASVTLGNGLEHIGWRAFEDCSALTAIVISDSVKTIGGRAFGDCTSLASVTIGSGVSDLEGNSFEGCSALNNIVMEGNANYVIEDGIIFTSDKATLVEYLAGNDRTSYVVPDSVTEIGYAAFCSGASLKEVGLPQNLKKIGGWAFTGTGLYDISIPEQTEEIGDYAFYHSCQEAFIYSRKVAMRTNTFYSFPSTTLYGYEGSTAQEYVISNNRDWRKLKFIAFSESGTEQGLPIGVQYVPYEVSLRNVTGFLQDASYTLADGSLPEGITLNSDGLLTGIPAQDGRFVFTVRRSNGDSAELTAYLLEIRDNTNVNVEEITDKGYELTEFVPDLNLKSVDIGRNYTLCSRGDYAEFTDVYLDGRKLSEGVDYTSAPGSTRITIRSQTLIEKGTGMHTIGIEFRTSEGRLKRAAQNYTVTDIVNVGGGSGDTEGNVGGGNVGSGSGNGEGSSGSSPVGNGSSNTVGNSGSNAAENSGADGDSLTEASDSVSSMTITYIVQKGDTLWRIAARYYGSGRYWQRIYQDNIASIRNPNLLRIGQVLTIYLDSQNRETEEMDAVQTGTSYTVQPGDNLWRIAVRFYDNGNLWRQIYLANQNRIRDWRFIFTRQVLFIPKE